LLAALLLFFALEKFLANEEAVDLLIFSWRQNLTMLLLVLLLIPLNWFLETAKWKQLVSVSEKITWGQACSAVLAGLAIGSATPNRIGEFAGRVFQMKSTPVRDGIAFTLVSSAMQVAVTILFGVFGFLMTDPGKYFHSNKLIVWTILVVVLGGAAILYVRMAKGKVAKYLEAIRNIKPLVLITVFALSTLRYLVYSVQFFIMLRLAGIDSGATELFSAIAVNYLVVTIIPSVMFSEIIVRGTVATAVIGGLCGAPRIVALAAVVLWMLNVALPATIGLFFVKNITFFRKK